LEFWYGAWLRIFDDMCTGRYIRIDLDFKDERALWHRLLNATSPDEVKAACDETLARGRSTSAPVDVETAIGMKPKLATKAVISTAALAF
jgi:hypothetical protein